MPSSTRPGHETLGQYRMASSAGRSTGVPHAGQRSGIRNGAPRVLGSTPSSTGRSTWGITSPARMTSTRSPTRMSFCAIRSSLCSVAALTVTPVISTGASTAYGLSAPVRPTLIRMLLQPGDGHLGRELPGDGPAWLAAADDAELAVEVEPVHLDHDAVGLERRAAGSAPPARRSPPARRPASANRCAMGLDLEAPGGELVEQLPVGARPPAGPRPARRRRRTCGAGACRVRLGSSWRRPPAAALRGLAKSGSPSRSRCLVDPGEAGIRAGTPRPALPSPRASPSP